MHTIDPKAVSAKELYGHLAAAVGPRPIAFASTVDAQGRVNLSPYSFFNVFSSNPPVLAFSCVRRMRDGSIKHTLQNIEATGEVVVNIVNYSIVQQMSLSSTEYDEGVDEFVKSGLTKTPSELVKPPRVAEAPVQMECKMLQIIALGDEGGAGNLILCEVVKLHIANDVLDGEGKIDQHKIDQVARMGGNWYTRANQGMFEVPKPLSKKGMGVDAMPENVRKSEILTGNDLGKLGNVEHLPGKEEIEDYLEANIDLRRLSEAGDTARLHRRAQELLHEEEPYDAWKLLLSDKSTLTK
ncbi:flavin reductase family protein [Flavimarina sp. Hel_I_48]|uniref:flavin reductase family protein n=1 Tax=Flavimarina sp. Hel_I_48 TaxID=1392488 RepID=UPI0004DED197|nr:flavin reductase family protein [Flavimarina sp. Hel_I_48]